MSTLILPCLSTHPDLYHGKYVAGLFANGEPGAWYDPSDFSTMFQDAAGTIPVTAVEQPVGKMLDKSGRGNHASQATTTKRPTLKQDANGCYYLSFDGVDDAMQTGNIDFTATDKMTVWAGVRKSVDTSGMLIEMSADLNQATGAFFIATGVVYGYQFISKGTSNGNALVYNYPAPRTNVFTGVGNISGDISSVRLNGSQVAISTSNQGTGNYGNYPLYIGSRAGTSIPFNGHIYSLIVRGAQSTDAQIISAETYANQKTGAYI